MSVVRVRKMRRTGGSEPRYMWQQNKRWRTTENKHQNLIACGRRATSRNSYEKPIFIPTSQWRSAEFGVVGQRAHQASETVRWLSCGGQGGGGEEIWRRRSVIVSGRSGGPKSTAAANSRLSLIFPSPCWRLVAINLIAQVSPIAVRRLASCGQTGLIVEVSSTCRRLASQPHSIVCH